MQLAPNVNLGYGSGTRLAAGLAVSLLAHVLLVLAYRADRPPRNFTLESRHAPLAIWIRPAPPAVAEPLAAKQPPKPAVQRPAGAMPMPRVIALEPAARTEPAVTVDESAQPAHFDMDAARVAARAMANEPVLSAQGRIRERRIVAETKLERDIARADRRDCKDGIPGELLAPLYLLMDKKDHGCKW